MSLYFMLVALHVFGLDVGIGTCTVTYVLGAYGMLNPKIMPKAVVVFKILSLLIWVGLFLLLTSGIALYFTSAATYGDAIHSKLFFMKMVFVVLLTINGLFLNIIVNPMMDKAVELPNFEKTPEYRKALLFGAIGAGISATCWYGAFSLGLYIFRLMV